MFLGALYIFFVSKVATSALLLLKVVNMGVYYFTNVAAVRYGMRIIKVKTLAKFSNKFSNEVKFFLKSAVIELFICTVCM